ncbi:N-6 DNA methylase [Calothrix sp. NIES-2098]|uniref:N-6 DNA methylase n=1 Tax=Calothrix sp. NIES-2098 TaxID=1954171 RepID=UPI000B5F70E2|nr:hypothetical protein NIES2098_13140 [Calothrix sp. NIES-2098]
MLVENYTREFSTKLLSLVHSRSRYEVFRDWVEVATITSQQVPYHQGILKKDELYEQGERRYLEIVQHYDRDSLQVFAEMFGLVQLVLSTAKSDFLGQLHQELNIGWKADLGQFFMPYPVAKLMARLSIDKHLLDEQITQKGYVSFQEPAVGAGSFLIAAAEVIEELGYNPQECMYFEAVDLDSLCANMTYIQLSALGISGTVIHGNSLSLEVYGVRYTPALLIAKKFRELHDVPTLTQQVEERFTFISSSKDPQVQDAFDVSPRQLSLFEEMPAPQQTAHQHKANKQRTRDDTPPTEKQLDLFEDL